MSRLRRHRHRRRSASGEIEGDGVIGRVPSHRSAYGPRDGCGKLDGDADRGRCGRSTGVRGRVAEAVRADVVAIGLIANAGPGS